MALTQHQPHAVVRLMSEAYASLKAAKANPHAFYLELWWVARLEAHEAMSPIRFKEREKEEAAIDQTAIRQFENWTNYTVPELLTFYITHGITKNKDGDGP
jgi:hypothetical protein